MQMEKRTYTLYELNGMVSVAVQSVLPGQYWVEAELSEVRERSGHCYMELVEKQLGGNTPIARAQAKCWRSTWAQIGPRFMRQTGQALHPGMTIRALVSAQFHEAFGFSWIVADIDAAFTLGNMAMKRMEIIRRLRDQGVIDMNKELPLPVFANRVAVISSDTAAGYGDFAAQLMDNEYGYTFSVTLFPAIMQGERVEESVIAALNTINAAADKYDCVVIIRGGGATSDLAGFDTLALAENVANFPLPVITGIGHDRDESVLDMVANRSLKTPTAAAALLIGNLKTVDDHITNLGGRLLRLAQTAIDRCNLRLDVTGERLRSVPARIVAVQQHRVSMLEQALPAAARHQMQNRLHGLEMLEGRTKALDPKLLLHRGYSITLHNGKAVRNVAQLKSGSEITTVLEKGRVKSTVN